MSKNQNGFSMVELILVVVILAIISIISIPLLQKAVGAARNGNAFASLKTISSVQVAFFTRNNRFARLDELNTEANNSLGTIDGDSLIRGYFTLTMNPINPTDSDLAQDYEIIASKPASVDNTPCVLSLTGSGKITELFGTNCINDE